MRRSSIDDALLTSIMFKEFLLCLAVCEEGESWLCQFMRLVGYGRGLGRRKSKEGFEGTVGHQGAVPAGSPPPQEICVCVIF